MLDSFDKVLIKIFDVEGLVLFGKHIEQCRADLIDFQGYTYEQLHNHWDVVETFMNEFKSTGEIPRHLMYLSRIKWELLKVKPTTNPPVEASSWRTSNV